MLKFDKGGVLYSDTLIFVKISAKPVDIVLMQVHMPTTNHDDDELGNCTTKLMTYSIKKEEVK